MGCNFVKSVLMYCRRELVVLYPWRESQNYSKVTMQTSITEKSEKE
jgi:hypothetical protein